ncbi:lipase secretion chaperone [Paraburkholderia acidicola]|uniref:Lipase chaperone n=1 Tax=Paraburkholderia acidicola TaxID=1912599 RepID=A0ABV1LI22_9BURK
MGAPSSSTSPVNSRRTATTWVIGAAALCGALIYGFHSRQVETVGPDSSRAPAKTGASPFSLATISDASTIGPQLPASLQGTTVPRLPIDDRGSLRKTKRVRDFYDYFLTTQNEISPTALDHLVNAQIAVQLENRPGQREAEQLWGRYRAYLTSLDQIQHAPQAQPSGPLVTNLDVDAIQLALDQRTQLADQHLGEWATVFFGDDEQQQRFDLARLRISTDPRLSDADKTRQLAALDQTLPADQQIALQKLKLQQQHMDSLSQIEKQQLSPQEMQAQIAQTLGPAVAQRVAQMAQVDQAWNTSYANYARQRDQILAEGLLPQDRDAQLAQLRQQSFPQDSDARRAAALDSDVVKN